MFTSPCFEAGATYTRAELKERFNITDQTLYTGIFRPAGYDSIWLFVTERKTADMTAYTDWLDGNILYWDGQTSGRNDKSIIEHERIGQELLLFYRANKVEYPGGGFRYEGRFRYSSHTGANPTHFILQRKLT
ncbi:MAG TPA: hypothetical protein VHI51_05425 [Ktedonobacterales bacterium]|jgi:putative restriction endonuclease|nr:hypothetical protein [Ktedonobacterales bacterium]